MPHSFYSKKEYQEKQSAIMKENWRKGLFDCIRRREKRKCKREDCTNVFEVIISDAKVYCCRSCSAKVGNIGRVHSEETRLKMSKALRGRKNPHAGIIRVPRPEKVCANPKCNKLFVAIEWGGRNRKFCSNKCAMAVIGGKPTSPKASKGKAGIRKDIDKTIYFYSRWEANYARLLNYLGVKWQYEPKTFDLGSQNYTPDFYLPKTKTYVEVKNFLWKYSKIRDKKFREIYPNIKLKLLLKEDYLKLQNKYSHLIKNWEYRNSPFESETIF